MSKKYVINVKDFATAFDICCILFNQENIDIRVKAEFHADKSGQGNIEYTITYFYNEE